MGMKLSEHKMVVSWYEIAKRGIESSKLGTNRSEYEMTWIQNDTILIIVTFLFIIFDLLLYK